jgi:hypothetical protein
MNRFVSVYDFGQIDVHKHPSYGGITSWLAVCIKNDSISLCQERIKHMLNVHMNGVVEEISSIL